MTILTKYRDVAAALRELPLIGGEVPVEDHRHLRDAAHHLYSPAMLPQFEAMARRFQFHAEVELVAAFAEPWALRVAALVTQVPLATAEKLVPDAWTIFEAGPECNRATARVASLFPPASAALLTQAFVALSVSLPAFLGNAWLALLQNRQQFEWIPGTHRD